jgi:hypothetical protein
MRNAIQFLAYSQLLTACAACLLYVGIASHQDDVSGTIGLFMFSSTWFVYLFHRLYKSRKNQLYYPPMRFWIARRFHKLFLLLVLLGVSCLITCWWLTPSIEQLIYLTCAMLISVFYIVPIVGYSLRTIPFLKSGLLALVWASQLTIFPRLNDGFQSIVWLECMTWFMLFYAISIPYDIRDNREDDVQMKTLPQWIGLNAAAVIATLLVLGFSLISAKFNLNNRENTILCCIMAVLIVLILYARKPRSPYFYLIFDGILLVLGATIFRY